MQVASRVSAQRGAVPTASGRPCTLPPTSIGARTRAVPEVTPRRLQYGADVPRRGDALVVGSSDAMDVVATASQLIASAAQKGDAKNVAHFVSTLQGVLDASHTLYGSGGHAAAAPYLSVTSAQLADVMQRLSEGAAALAQHPLPAGLDAAASVAAHLPNYLPTATLPSDPTALDPATLSAATAVAGLVDGAGGPAAEWEAAAASLAAWLGATQQPAALALQALGSLASQRLSVLADIDPAAAEALRAHLSTAVNAVASLATSAGGGGAPDAGGLADAASHATQSLVLGLQQLVGGARGGGGGAFSLAAMLQAQDAMDAAAAAASAVSTGSLPAAAAAASSARSVAGVPASSAPGFDGVMALTIGMVAVVVSSLPRSAVKVPSKAEANEGGVPLRYSPESLSQYWADKPGRVVARSTEIVGKLVVFLLQLVGDAQTGQWEANMPRRAADIRKMLEGLGATCVKIGQALSTRVDMLPKVYLDEFARLQDNVATFSTMEARVVLEEGLGLPVDAVFEWMSEEPVAAASLGQVYRGKLRPEYGSSEVAVKVQRPGVLESAALDVFIMRRAAVLFSKLPGMSDGWANVLDDWALRFFQEMDYQLEAYNTMTFKQQMANLKGIEVPTIHPDITSRKVIVSDWIDGKSLRECEASEIRSLCSTLLNCYLIQLLETGLLHADPHPGNLMVTHDGRLVILDFGLMTEVTEAQRIGLVEFIAHLTMEDWDALTGDLVTLGFMPEDMSEEARSLIRPVMTDVFSKIVSGGGLGKAGLNFSSLAISLSHISMSYQLCIPGYFTNVIRAFSVIEGTALKVDPDYAIVQECSPYLSRRLLTDNNPRMRAALRQLLYGNGKRLDIARLSKMMQSFSAFTTSATPAGGSASSGMGMGSEDHVKGGASSTVFGAYRQEAPVLNETMCEALKVVFAKDGSYAQELIVEELVAATDAMSREALSEALHLVLGSATAVSALRGMEALGPLRAMLAPIPLPIEMLHAMEPAVALTSDDRQALSTVRAVLGLLTPSASSVISGMPGALGGARTAVRAATEVLPMLPDLLPGLQVTGEMFVRQLVRRMALRLADDLAPADAKTAMHPSAATAGGTGTGAASGSGSATYGVVRSAGGGGAYGQAAQSPRVGAAAEQLQAAQPRAGQKALPAARMPGQKALPPPRA